MTRRTVRRREAQLAFEALTIEGGLLSPEWLAKVAQLQAGQQTEADYRIPKGLNLRDEIGRYWRIAQAHWGELRAGLARGAEARSLALRVLPALLRDAFGFGSLTSVEAVEVVGRAYPIGHAALAGRVPVVIAPAATGVDTLDPGFGDGTRRRSPFGLAQEYVNAEERSVWGIATDGVAFRLVRDNASLTRPAWIEADLARMFTEDRFADFAALWLLAHETRFGAADHPASDCPLEAWRNAGREQGTRAREHLRDGVEEALIALGRGVLAHPENQRLRAALHGGSLTRDAYFQELLRLVYRLIFLLTAEERGLLHPDGSDEAARRRYAEGYAMRRLRERAVRRSAHDRHSDVWDGIRIVLRGLARGELRLALPALGGLFDADKCTHLDEARLENRAVLTAVFKLSWLRDESGLARVNWRDMGPEELGSVYESLLELVPQITDDGRGFSFATGAETKGNARKKTGSYYTPEGLVQVLLESALEPVVQQTIAGHPEKPAEALLQLSIVDPACGSGHFLLAAARRLAGHIARLQADGTPSAAEYRHALRQVVSRCLFGVDLNPMAVELCRVSLWMEAMEPGRPLSFLDSHIQQGNALLGATPELMAKGIPDAAFEPIEGDDTRTASHLKRKNKAAAEGQRGFDALWSRPAESESAEVTQAVAALESAPDTSLAEVVCKEARWEELHRSQAFQHQKFVADGWCAAFVWPKPPTDPKKVNPLVAAAPTNDLWRQIRDGQGAPPPLTVKAVEDLAKQYAFFHWHLAFPQVFARGGFDVVVGNPPWERLKLQTDEWMIAAGIDVALAVNAAARNKLLAATLTQDESLRLRWQKDRRKADGVDLLVRSGGRFPRTAAGDMNAYALFAELGVALLNRSGHGSWVLPLGVVTDKTYAALCTDLLEKHRLRAVVGFVNERQLFAEVMHNFKFVALSVAPSAPERRASFVFGVLDPQEAPRETRERGYDLDARDVAALNPDTLTCPVFMDGRMAQVLVALHRALPPMSQAGWNVKPQAMLHMGAASKHFTTERTKTATVPVYESKMVNRYNHRFASFAALEVGERSHMLPRSTVAQLADDAYEAEPGYYCAPENLRDLGSPPVEWFLVFRRIANPALARTSAFAFVPKVGLADSLSAVVPRSTVSPFEWARDAALLCWLGNSAVWDAVLKQKMGGNNFSEYVWNQLPVPEHDSMAVPASWLGGAAIDSFVVPRVAELTLTSRSLLPLARDLGYPAVSSSWNAARRRHVEAELDAAAAMVFGISEDDFRTLFDAFPVLMAREVEGEGAFTTRNMAVQCHADMVRAARAAAAYETSLDPAPVEAKPVRTAKPPVRVAKRMNVAALPDCAWMRPKVEHAAEVGVVLAAVLKAFGRPVPIRQVRLAAALALEPTLVLASATGKEANEWRRLVGDEAEPSPRSVTSIAAPTNRAWGSAVIQLRGNRLLVEDGKAGTWGPGTGLEQILTHGWPDGRARWVVDLILRRGEKDVIQKLSPELQRWVHGAQAA